MNFTQTVLKDTINNLNALNIKSDKMTTILDFNIPQYTPNTPTAYPRGYASHRLLSIGLRRRSWPGRGLYDELITRPKESYQVSNKNNKPKKRGQAPAWDVKATDDDGDDYDDNRECPVTLCKNFEILFLRLMPVRNVVWTRVQFSTLKELRTGYSNSR
jgi:hypothetical protein